MLLVVLFFRCLLDGAEDLRDFAVERGEVEVDDAAAGVEDDVDGQW